MTIMTPLDAENIARDVELKQTAIELLRRRRRPMTGYVGIISGLMPFVALFAFVTMALKNNADALIWLVGLIAIVGIFAVAAEQRRLARELEAVIALLDQDGRFGVRKF